MTQELLTRQDAQAVADEIRRLTGMIVIPITSSGQTDQAQRELRIWQVVHYEGAAWTSVEQFQSWAGQQAMKYKLLAERVAKTILQERLAKVEYLKTGVPDGYAARYEVVRDGIVLGTVTRRDEYSPASGTHTDWFARLPNGRVVTSRAPTRKEATDCLLERVDEDAS